MQQSAQEGPGGDYDAAAPDRKTEVRFYPCGASLFDEDFRDAALFYVQPGCALKERLYPKLIRLLVALHPGRSHTRSLGAVKETKLQACRVRINSHGATQGIDLSNDMPFCQAPDRGIARHLTDRVQVLTEK